MATSVQSNRLLPLIGGVVAILVVLVLSRACSGDADPQASQLAAIPEAPSPDLDSPAETLLTLSAELGQMNSRLEELNRENQTLKERQRELEEQRQTERLAATATENDKAEPGRVDALIERLDRLQRQVQEGTSQARDDLSGLDVPVGLGLDGDPPRDMGDWTGPAEQLVWVAPLGFDDEQHAAGRPARPAPEATPRPEPEPASEPEPRHTVPRNATLIGSTAMTALVGRIPRQGSVEDPMPFKVIVGRDNLAANGHTVPGVDSMIFSGTAVGDWTLSCVRGKLESVTYVFEDGTIRTLMDPDGESDTLGWISDSRGVPCVSGQRITNAPAYLSQAMTLATMQAAAESAAASQTTTIATGDSSSAAVTGQVGRFIAGRAVSGGIEEIVQWLRERQEQHFDAVFAPAGVEVAIHLDRELRIDHDPHGRRLSHDTRTPASRYSPRLD